MTTDIEAVKAIIQANSTVVYEDAAQPSVRVVGKALAQCTSLFATPVGRIAEIFEKNLHRYLDKLEGLPEEKIVAPKTRILVPILEKLRYTDDDMVADYYAQILATASTPESAQAVSVAFIEILNRLCADELRMLEFINSDSNFVLVTIGSETPYIVTCNGILPVINVHVKQKSGGYRVAIKNLSYLVDKVKLEFPANYNMYMDNMFALGLILKPALIRAQDTNVYQAIKMNIAVKKCEAQLTEGQTIEYSEGRIETTDLGMQLLSVGSSYEKK